MFHLVLMGMLATAGPLETAPRPHVPPLTGIQSIRQLSPEECARKQHVRITGVVTFANSEKVSDFWLQDASAGIYVLPTPATAGLKPGDRVEVEGVTNPGGFAPCVESTRVTWLDRDAQLPIPLPFNLAPEESRWLDGQYVQVWGVVSAVRSNGPNTVIAMYNAHGRASVCIPDPRLAATLARLKDRAVTIRGVCVPSIDTKERIINNDFTHIFMNGVPMAELTVEETRVTQAIDHLLRFSPSPHPGARRAIVTGVVVARSADGELYVQDPTGGIAVRPEVASPDLAVGQRVEVTGMLGIEGRRLSLAKAKIRTLGNGEIPAATPADPASLAQGFYHATLVDVTGRVDEFAQYSGWTAITLVDGATRFDVLIPGEFPAPPQGSRIKVTAVPSRQHPKGLLPSGFALWTNSPTDVALLELPAAAHPSTWWTTNRIIAAVAIPLILALLAFTWVMTLRRQVHRQTAELRDHFETEAELEERLRTSQKLEAIGRLAGGIAHDFNNLLTVINGCGELLANDLDPGSPQRDLARDIRSAGERAASLVSQLLLFSRRQSVRLHALDLRSTVKEAERMLKRVIGETIRVQCDIAGNTPTVKAEATLVHQIVLNLAVNARDAMPVGGTLRIATSRYENENGTFARLTVADSGIGMDDATRNRIFEPFFTTKSIGAGTGLGLATVYGIVQTLEGDIHCRSTLGQGTTFEIDIPAVNAVPSLLGDSSGHRSVTSGRGTVLVCEDDGAVRDLTCRILETAGYDVLAAETPTEAAKLAQTHPGSIELLLTDVVMPGINGRELAELIRPLRPDMRVVFMTGYTNDEMLRQGLAAEEVELIGKPFSPATLTAKINAALHPSSSEMEVPAGIR